MGRRRIGVEPDHGQKRYPDEPGFHPAHPGWQIIFASPHLKKPIPSRPHSQVVMSQGYRWDALYATHFCGKITTYSKNRHNATQHTEKLRQLS
jgi:hypothetical protein